MDESTNAVDRCNAIEKLATGNVPLMPDAVQQLLSSKSSDVARFALGLVQMSDDRDALIAAAQSQADNGGDVAFKEELSLLKELLASA
jgi:hypothetical protein